MNGKKERQGAEGSIGKKRDLPGAGGMKVPVRSALERRKRIKEPPVSKKKREGCFLRKNPVAKRAGRRKTSD